MSTDPKAPTEEDLQAAYEAQLSQITATEMILQAAVSLLNIGARRMGLTGPAAGDQPPPQRDLDQVRDAIDGVRGLLTVLQRSAPQDAKPLRDALSQLQLAYAREANDAPTGATAQPAAPAPTEPSKPAPSPGETPAEGPAPGPAESSGRLWVPGR